MGIRCCKDCLTRSAECHSTCEIYKRESEAHQQKLEENRIKDVHHRHVLDVIYKHKYDDAVKRKKSKQYARVHR